MTDPINDASVVAAVSRLPEATLKAVLTKHRNDRAAFARAVRELDPGEAHPTSLGARIRRRGEVAPVETKTSLYWRRELEKALAEDRVTAELWAMAVRGQTDEGRQAFVREMRGKGVRPDALMVLSVAPAAAAAVAKPIRRLWVEKVPVGEGR